MKKFLIFLFLFFVGWGSVGASWTINGTTSFNASGYITSCTGGDNLNGTDTSIYPSLFRVNNGIYTLCGNSIDWTVGGVGYYDFVENTTFGVLANCGHIIPNTYGMSGTDPVPVQEYGYTISNSSEMDLLCGPNTTSVNMNPMTTVVNNTASGALAEVAEISSGSLGQIIIFFIAFALLISIVTLIYLAFRKKG